MTSTTDQDGAIDEILPTDERGRVRVSAQRREEILGAYDASGMNAAQFARWSGVKYPTLAGWLQRRREAREADGSPAAMTEPGKAVRWMEAVGEDARAGACPGQVVIALPGGVRLEVADRQGVVLAAALIATLGTNRR